MTDPARDTDGARGNRATSDEGLPVWTLDDLYRSPDDPVLRMDLERVAADAARFAERWAGKIAGLSGNRLVDAIEAYERIDERMGRLSSYAQLLHAGDRTDPQIGRFYQTCVDAPFDASIFFGRLSACGQVLSCVRPLNAARHTPRALMEMRGPVPYRLRELESSASGSWFSRSRLD